jgi:hypothetical protein
LELADAFLELGAEPNRIEDTAFAGTVATIQGLAALAQAPAFGKALRIPELLGLLTGLTQVSHAIADIAIDTLGVSIEA